MTKFLMAAMTAVALAGCGAMTGGQRSAGSSAAAVDDTTIATKTKAAIAADPELAPLKIDVAATEGKVRLKGEVKTITLRRKAEDAVRKVDGVKSVDNQLVITG